MKWEELSTTRLATLPRETACILPLGATEQHGPHLPLGTDRLIATALADRLDDACGGRLLVMPAPPTGCSDHHLAFPGTLSLRHETFRRVVMETIGGATRHGFRRFLLLNAHGGNGAIGGVIAEQAASEWPEAEVIFATWFRAVGDRLRHLVAGEYPAVGHACEFETSLLLALRPELVDMAAAVDDGDIPSSPFLRGDLLNGSRAVLARPFDRFTRSGTWGKPTLATAEKGREILAITVSTLRDLLSASWPDAPGATGTHPASHHLSSGDRA